VFADLDGDGKDEIVYGAMAVNDDGTGLWNSGLGHGDALHVSDIDPNRPGLEIWGIHEQAQIGSALLDGKTGKIIWEPDLAMLEEVSRQILMIHKMEWNAGEVQMVCAVQRMSKWDRLRLHQIMWSGGTVIWKENCWTTRISESMAARIQSCCWPTVVLRIMEPKQIRAPGRSVR